MQAASRPTANAPFVFECAPRHIHLESTNCHLQDERSISMNSMITCGKGRSAAAHQRFGCSVWWEMPSLAFGEVRPKPERSGRSRRPFQTLYLSSTTRMEYRKQQDIKGSAQTIPGQPGHFACCRRPCQSIAQLK